MLQEDNTAIISIFVKLPFVIKILFCLFLNGRFTQVLLYYRTYFIALAQTFVHLAFVKEQVYKFKLQATSLCVG